jgi:Lhr-like helicase
MLRWSRVADVLDRFSAATRAWFAGTFAAPTPAQAQGWAAIAQAAHTLILAPTGSGKTLAAFLWCLDRLASEPVPADPKRRCRVLYVSPLKALAVDVERNLSTPLTGVGRVAERRGVPAPNISVGVRSGDTPPARRRELITKPPDILITTPESLFLMLTSAARDSLAEGAARLVDELRLSLEYYAAQEGAVPIEGVVACGPGTTIPGLMQRLQRDLGQRFEIGRPQALAHLDESTAARLTLSFGLALEE